MAVYIEGIADTTGGSAGEDVVKYLDAEGINDPADLGFLAGPTGGFDEGAARAGCPPSWGPP